MNASEAVQPQPLAEHEASFRLAEYQSLRTEILQNQSLRIVVLGLVLAALGVTSGLLLDGGSGARVAVFSGFQFLLLLPAINVTTVLTRRNEVIAAYIETEIEVTLAGSGWEGTLTRARVDAPRRRLAPTPLNTSHALAIAYGVLVAAGGLVFLAAAIGNLGFWESVAAGVAPLVGGGVCLYSLIQLRMRDWPNPLRSQGTDRATQPVPEGTEAR